MFSIIIINYVCYIQSFKTVNYLSNIKKSLSFVNIRYFYINEQILNIKTFMLRLNNLY